MLTNEGICPIYCFNVETKIIKDRINEKDLLIDEETNADGEKRALYFSVIGNNPEHPRIALVGLSPGQNQLNNLRQEYNENKDDNKHDSFIKAARESGFYLYKKIIYKILKETETLETLELLDIKEDTDFNNHPNIFVTSLVKCSFLKLKGEKYRSKSFDPLKFECAIKCIKNRFIRDIDEQKTKGLKRILIFGKDGWNALKELGIKDVLRDKGLKILACPHPSYLRRNSKTINENIKSYIKKYN